GLFNEASGYAARATFVVDKEGIIRSIEEGRTAIDPTGAYQACSVFEKKKTTTPYLFGVLLPLLLPGGRCFINRIAQPLRAKHPKHHTVDEYRRRAAYPIYFSVFDVVLYLGGIAATVKCRIKFLPV